MKTIEYCDGKKFYLPDGVSVFDNGNIVVADGGNDRICLLSHAGQTLKSIGDKGFGHYKFKEPVGVFVSPAQKAYVVDWHNHRVVIYDQDLEYLGEFGHYGRISAGEGLVKKLEGIIRFLERLSYKGSYQRYHFKLEEKIPHGNMKYSFKLLLKGLLYWRNRNNNSFMSSIRVMVSQLDAMDKPNGVAFYKDKIYVSQKNARCVSAYDKVADSDAAVFLKYCYGPDKSTPFGRLGNITCDEAGHIYVCDEYAHKIWILDHELKYKGKILGGDSGMGTFMPFSCCLIQENILAVCGCLNFQIIDLDTSRVLYCSDSIGEVHSIAYHAESSNLYLSDRSNGSINVFTVEKNNNREYAQSF